MNRVLTALLLMALSFTASAEVHTAPYGVSFVLPFKLYNTDGTLDVDEVDGGTEVSVRCQGGTNATATNDFVDKGSDYEITLTATEMQCATVVVTIAATTTEVTYINTANNASAAIPQLNANVTQFGGTNGTFASGRPEVNTSHIAGSAVSTSSAQIGVNVVNAGGTAWGSGAITAASIATDAITNAKIATDAIGASELAADAIGATEIANAAIDAATFASGAIDATAIATDAIGAAEIAADAGTELGTATWATTTRQLTSAQTFNLTGSITGNLSGSVGSVTGSVGSISTGGITEASYATTAGSFDALGIIDQGTAQAATGTTLQLRSAAAFADDEIIGATCLITGGTTGVGQARTITDYVASTDTATVATWTTTPTGTISYECFGTAAASGSGGGATAAEVWAYSDRQLTAFDEDVTTIDINATATGAAASVTGAVGSVTGNVGGNVTGSVGSVATGGITAASIATDAIGAAEIAADAGTELGTAMWATTTRLLTAGTNIALAKGTGITGFNDIAATDVWAAGTRTLSAGTNIVLAKGTGVTGFNDPAASAIADAVWDEARTGHTTSGTFGFYVDSAISGVSTGGVSAGEIADAVWDEALSGHATGGTAGAALTTASSASGLDAAGVRAAIGLATANLDIQLAAVQSDADNIQTRLPAALVSGRMDSSVGAMASNTVTAAAAAADLTTELQAGLATSAGQTAITDAITALNNMSPQQLRDLIIEDQGGGVSLGCALSVILSYASGDVATTGANSTYEDPSGTETRATGTVTSNGNRAATITCPSY